MDVKQIDVKVLILSLVLCVGGGMISGFVSGIYGDYTSFVRPDLYPPGWAFSVVWTVLYVLMAISISIVYSSADADGRKVPFMLFGLQLIMNFAWSPVFFVGSYYLAGFVLLIAILVTVLAMIWAFMRVNKTAGYLQLPYVVWLCIAGYLSYSVVTLN